MFVRCVLLVRAASYIWSCGPQHYFLWVLRMLKGDPVTDPTDVSNVFKQLVLLY